MATEKSVPPPHGGRKATNALIIAAIVLLAGAVLYLLSERNSRTYFLVPEGGALVVKKGKFFLQGDDVYKPESAADAARYANIPIPEFDRTLPPRTSFAERQEVDDALAGYLLKWSTKLVGEASETGALAAVQYLKRVRLFSSLSEAQKVEVDRLEREVSFYQGRIAVREAIGLLDKARDHLEHAASPGGNRSADASRGLANLDIQLGRMRTLIDMLDGKLVDEPQPDLVAPAKLPPTEPPPDALAPPTEASPAAPPPPAEPPPALPPPASPPPSELAPPPVPTSTVQ